MEMLFESDKSRHLQEIIDKSRKGEVDKPIRHLVQILNESDCYFTTSSCSGRIILFSNSDRCEDEDTVGKRKKQGCEWLYVSHEVVEPECLIGAIEECTAPSMLKFEPFILHVRCASLDNAKKLLTTSIESGFKNSGLTIGKANRITLAVRSCLVLETPLSPEFSLGSEYLKYLTEVANMKMKENMEKIERFTKNVEQLLVQKE